MMAVGLARSQRLPLFPGSAGMWLHSFKADSALATFALPAPLSPPPQGNSELFDFHSLYALVRVTAPCRSPSVSREFAG